MDLIEEIHVCSAASKHGKYQQQVKVGAKTTQSVPFVIIPTREGQYRIEVKAAIKGDSLATDGVMKMLRVVVRETCCIWSQRFDQSPLVILSRSHNLLTINKAKIKS